MTGKRQLVHPVAPGTYLLGENRWIDKADKRVALDFSRPVYYIVPITHFRKAGQALPFVPAEVLPPHVLVEHFSNPTDRFINANYPRNSPSSNCSPAQDRGSSRTRPIDAPQFATIARLCPISSTFSSSAATPPEARAASHILGHRQGRRHHHHGPPRHRPHVLQPRHRRHRQRPDGARNRRPRRTYSPRSIERHQHPVPHAQQSKGPAVQSPRGIGGQIPLCHEGAGASSRELPEPHDHPRHRRSICDGGSKEQRK